jgi:hypothetical protein
VSVLPGRSLLTPLKKVSSPETNRLARNSGRMASFSSAGNGAASRIALISDANSRPSGVRA